jgi:hypothetical protein
VLAFGSVDTIREAGPTTLKEHNNEFQENCGAIRDRGRVGL